ncbi:MAG TPA: hypothetical protein DEA71_06385 [Nitrospira sp.]|nr:hypothetical protein [Nitrospira sp.]
MGMACLVVLLCVCVVTQMLGAPVTLIDLMNSDMLTKSEPVSEGFSFLSPSLEPEKPSLLHFFAESRLVLQLPVLATSVFRPPSM